MDCRAWVEGILPRHGVGPAADTLAVAMAAIRSTVTTASAPAAIGPYSQAAIAGEGEGALLFCSGQLPLDPGSGRIVSEDIGEQAERCLANLRAVCDAAGADLADALRLTIYTTDLASFAQINEAYATFFAAEPPARATVGVAALPMDAKIEIDAIVAVSAAPRP